MRGGAIIKCFGAGLALAVMAGCALAPGPAPEPAQRPAVRPAVARVAPAARPVPSAASRALLTHYARLQSDLLTRGLLRTDGGGIDTPFTDTDLIRNFERVALYEEYARGRGLVRSSGGEGRLKRWDRPIRVSVEFGASVSPEIRATDSAEVTRYTQRLARVTGHPMAMSDADANFHVLVMGEDERAQIAPRIRELVPNVNPSALAIFRSLPRSIYCVVLAFSGSQDGYNYARAIAVVRAEQPDLMRKSCIHEEMAQGMGLTNDSPQARPSIFNDDDEFAFLTTHDELLLKILYDPRLTHGMRLEEALPVVRARAAELAGSGSGSSISGNTLR